MIDLIIQQNKKNLLVTDEVLNLIKQIKSYIDKNFDDMKIYSFSSENESQFIKLTDHNSNICNE